MQSNKVAETLKIQMIPTFRTCSARLSSLQKSIQRDLRYFSSFIIQKLSRSQAIFIATEATRPSRVSTVDNGPQKRSVALFCGKNRPQGRHGPVAQLVRAHA